MNRTVPLRRLVPVLLLLWGGASGCARESDDVRLLIDGQHAPDVLLEQREVAVPPSLGGNRFLTGWWPWLDGDKRLVLAPYAPTTRMEMVSLGPGRRSLMLDLLEEGASKGRKVQVRAAGRDLGAFPLTDPLEIPLPSDLPVGRVPLELSFDRGTRGVLAAALRPSRPEGEVRMHGADLVQSGDSLVDLVHRVSGGETLVGSFHPPLFARAGQRFDLTVEGEDGAAVARFSWEASSWNGLRGSHRISLPLGDVQGFVRVRLRAAGEGPVGRWARLGLTGGEGGAAPPAAAAEPPAAPPRLVVVYVMDALRDDAVGHLGGRPGVSPVVDRLAREGITFRSHRSVAPNTIPSTKALFTGRGFVSGGDWPLAPKDGKTLAELFREGGYRTGLFSGNVYISSAFGTDRGFEHAAEEVLLDEEEGTGLSSRFNDNAARVQSAALDWLRSLPEGEQAFLYLHTIHPHNPYDPPEPFRSRYTRGIPSAIDGSTETLSAVRKGRLEPSRADQRRLRGLYTGSFAWNDAELEGFLRGLSRWAKPEETLVVLTSDHGEELFEHGGVLHGYTLYEEMMGIPLVLWSPGRLRPAEVQEPTDTLDLHATLLEMCGLRKPKGSEGRSLLAAARRPDREYIHLAAASSVVGGIYSARWGHTKLVWAPRYGPYWGMGDGRGRTRDPEYLFDLEQDPEERVNLAGNGGLEAAWLRSRLLAWVQRNRALTVKPPERPLDAETERKLRALGYANAK